MTYMSYVHDCGGHKHLRANMDDSKKNRDIAV